MLRMFGFERAAVLVSDLYFIDPNPLPGQESPERGVRLEVRLLDRGELHGSIYSAQPIGVGQPVWRADLLESVDNPGSLNRAHHHPQFSEQWDPGHRVCRVCNKARRSGTVGRSRTRRRGGRDRRR